MKRTALSRKAALAKGALAVFLAPKLATDAKVDLNKLLVGVTAANWTAKKSSIVAGLREATKGKLAADASIDDAPGMLDQLDDTDAGPDDNVGTDDPDKNLDAVEDPDGTNEGAKDDGPGQQVCAFLKGKLSDEDMAEVEAIMGEGSGATVDAEPNPNAEMIGALEALLAKMKGGAAPANDAENADKDLDGVTGKPGMLAKPTPAGPKPTPGAPAAPTTSNLKDKPMDKPAMDAAFKAHEKKIRQDMRDLAEAERVVRPFIGEIAIAMDSAEDVYKLALETHKIDLTGVPPQAYRAMVGMLPRPGEGQQPRIAQDTAASVTAFQQRFPGADRIRQLGH